MNDDEEKKVEEALALHGAKLVDGGTLDEFLERAAPGTVLDDLEFKALIQRIRMVAVVTPEQEEEMRAKFEKLLADLREIRAKWETDKA